jgi:hypothetical protein
MLKTVLVGACAGLIVASSVGLSACQKLPHHSKVRREAVKVHHMPKGRYAYQDSSGAWYWWVYADTRLAESKTETLNSPGSWVRGESPSPTALAEEIETVDITVAENAAGAPISEAEASAEAAAEGGGDSTSSSGPAADSPATGDSGGGGGDGGGGGGDGGGGGE